MKRIGVAAAIIVAAVIAYAIYRVGGGTAHNDEFDNLQALLDLPANRWILYHRGGTDGWTRQGHAGMTYDSDRGTLVIFGSDTHGENWDNSIHEFQPLEKRWHTRYPQSSAETYRLDAEGRPVAGDEALLPWAMHTYDTVEYDPQQKAIVVASTTEHSSLTREVGKISDHPTWRYFPANGTWEMLVNEGKKSPAFFAGGLAYDETRDVLIGYRGAIWELGPDRQSWLKTGATGPHSMHFNFVYDPGRGRAFVFGDYKPTCAVWSYSPGILPGTPGSWETVTPASGPCPLLSSAPVALDREAGLFLIVADDRQGGAATAQKASTYYYDPDSSSYHHLEGADLPPVGMNYMLAWDKRLKVFFLVTGSWNEPTSVWALRLDRSQP